MKKQKKTAQPIPMMVLFVIAILSVLVLVNVMAKEMQDYRTKAASQVTPTLQPVGSDSQDLR